MNIITRLRKQRRLTMVLVGLIFLTVGLLLVVLVKPGVAQQIAQRYKLVESYLLEEPEGPVFVERYEPVEADGSRPAEQQPVTIPDFDSANIPVRYDEATLQRLGWGDTPVQAAPAGFSSVIWQVSFTQPQTVRLNTALTRVSSAIMVEIRGGGFRPTAVPAAVWVNGVLSNETMPSEDGQKLYAYYFFESLASLEQAVSQLGRWEVIYQPALGGSLAYQVSPTGDPADAYQRPAVLPATQQALYDVD